MMRVTVSGKVRGGFGLLALSRHVRPTPFASSDSCPPLGSCT
ncbi:hypothetical protein [Lysobacter gummosus]